MLFSKRIIARYEQSSINLDTGVLKIAALLLAMTLHKPTAFLAYLILSLLFYRRLLVPRNAACNSTKPLPNLLINPLQVSAELFVI